MLNLDDVDEVFFSSADTSRVVNYAMRRGRIRRIARGLYTTNVVQPIEAVVRSNAWSIAAGYFPNAVISDRTATTFEPAEDGSIFLAGSSAREVVLPGLRLRARAGAGPQEGDQRWMGENLYMSSPARAALDNLMPSRARGGVRRTLTRRELEEWLERQASDVTRLNRLRDGARDLAPVMDREQQFAELDALLGALQGTRDAPLVSERGAARGRGEPFDARRLERFAELHTYLIRNPPPVTLAAANHELSTFAFYEAYFSNFIEGTEFTVDEAEEIVFRGVLPAGRPRDAHDVLGTYRIVADPDARSATPRSSDEFEGLLKRRHAAMLRARPEVTPGEYKTRANQAGGTVFVDPELVAGTLREAFRMFYDSVPPGLARAAFMMFVVSEVHPFIDGNGRIARIAANAELSAAGEQRIVVTIHDRDDYIHALRGMTHNGNARAYTTLLKDMQLRAAETAYSSRDAARESLRAQGAFTEEAGGTLLAGF
jgi:hypothetical protein